MSKLDEQKIEQAGIIAKYLDSGAMQSQETYIEYIAEVIERVRTEARLEEREAMKEKITHIFESAEKREDRVELTDILSALNNQK